MQIEAVTSEYAVALDRYLEAPQAVRNGHARPTSTPGSGMRFASRALAPYRG